MDEVKKLREKLKKRNYQEMIACVVVIIGFIYIGVYEEDIVAKAFCVEIILSAILIGHYLYTRSHKKLLEENDSKEQYVSILNNEIKLLSTLRYWYVLPPLIGLTGLIINDIVMKLNADKNPSWFIFYLCLTFCLAFGIIYLNEVRGVRKLKKELDLVL